MNKGFTLIETIIYLALATTLGVALLLWSIEVQGLSGRVTLSVGRSSELRSMINLITREIEQSSEIVAPLAGESGGELILKKFSGEDLRIYLSPTGRLMYQLGSNPPLELTSSELTFKTFVVTELTGATSAREYLTISFITEAIFTSPPTALTFGVNRRS